MPRQPRKITVRGDLREEPDVELLAIAFLMLAKSLREQREAGLIEDTEVGEDEVGEEGV